MVELEKEVTKTVTETKTFLKCDNCGQVLDDDEELHPVYIGDPPEPEPQQLEEIHRKETTRTPSVYGKDFSAYRALYEALRKENNIDVQLSDNARKMDRRNMKDSLLPSLDSKVEVGYGTTTGKYSLATVTIHHNYEKPDPDLEVCDYCKDSLSNDKS